MISNQIMQETLEGIKAITKVDLIVMDIEGRLLAKTAEDGPLDYEDAVMAFAESQAESQSLLGYQFFKVTDDKQVEYILLAKGDADSTYMVGKMAAFQIHSLLVAYKERSDKDNFIKNLLLDNLLLVDIYNRAKKLHIDTDVKRCVFIIETKSEKDSNALETVRNIFSVKTRDFITAVDEKNTCIEIFLTVDSISLFYIISEYFEGLHNFFLSSGNIVSVNLSIIKFAYITKNCNITVEIQNLIILREKIWNENAVVSFL